MKNFQKFLEKPQKGFTFIEAVVMIFVLLLAFGAVVGFLTIGYQTQSYGREQTQAIEEVKRGIETMVKEIREARTGDDGSYLIEKAADYEFIFYSNIDNDSAVERVRYFLEGSNFKKGVIKPEGSPLRYPSTKEEIKIISSHVINQPPIFRYFDGNNQELPAPSRLKDTKLMKVYLVINVDPNNPPNDFVLESDVQIRNLKTNLGD